MSKPVHSRAFATAYCCGPARARLFISSMVFSSSCAQCYHTTIQTWQTRRFSRPPTWPPRHGVYRIYQQKERTGEERRWRETVLVRKAGTAVQDPDIPMPWEVDLCPRRSVSARSAVAAEGEVDLGTSRKLRKISSSLPFRSAPAFGGQRASPRQRKNAKGWCV